MMTGIPSETSWSCVCVDPLDVSQGQHLINSVTEKISNKNVNIKAAVQIGEAQLQEFEWACPT